MHPHLDEAAGGALQFGRDFALALPSIAAPSAAPTATVTVYPPSPRAVSPHITITRAPTPPPPSYTDHGERVPSPSSALRAPASSPVQRSSGGSGFLRLPDPAVLPPKASPYSATADLAQMQLVHVPRARSKASDVPVADLLRILFPLSVACRSNSSSSSSARRRRASSPTPPMSMAPSSAMDVEMDTMPDAGGWRARRSSPLILPRSIIAGIPTSAVSTHAPPNSPMALSPCHEWPVSFDAVMADGDEGAPPSMDLDDESSTASAPRGAGQLLPSPPPSYAVALAAHPPPPKWTSPVPPAAEPSVSHRHHHNGYVELPASPPASPSFLSLRPPRTSISTSSSSSSSSALTMRRKSGFGRGAASSSSSASSPKSVSLSRRHPASSNKPPGVVVSSRTSVSVAIGKRKPSTATAAERAKCQHRVRSAVLSLARQLDALDL
ncbi:hypothetical protein H9P43_004882 [Blastocladiella emersonii ATCC 22665]|nr:hypothetical protein H9P43_004882 [Blastocladiella emersonii ATCC 22665]